MKIITVDDMKKVFDDGWKRNSHLKMSRVEYFREYGYGDDFGGYCFPIPEMVENVGEVVNVTHSDSLRIRDDIALAFTDDEFIAALAASDGL